MWIRHIRRLSRIHFEDKVVNSDDNKEDKEDLSDIPLSWVIEEMMLEEYFLLVRRIQGLGLSVKEYWELDTWTTAKLLSMEREIIEEEQKEYNKNKKEYVERPDGNSDEMNDLVDRMMQE